MNQLVLPVLAALFAVGLSSLVGLGRMVGAPEEINIDNDDGARAALDFAVRQHNRGSNSLFLSQVADVVKVQRQVVSGTNYIITVRMARTPCRKGSAAIEECAIQHDQASAPTYECTFEVWSRPWLNDTQLVGDKCKGNM